MNHLGKMSVWVVILFCATNQASLAVGPVEEDFDPPIMCVADGTCHVNGCQDTPDPDCGPWPGNSSSGNSSSGNSSSGNSCNTEYPYKDNDSVKLSDDQVYFGGEVWAGGVLGVAGWGYVRWSVIDCFYTPRLTGYIHLNNASGKYARMHISYWGNAGNRLDTRHSAPHRAPNDKHHSWEVDLLPLNQVQIFEVHVCTEISDDGDNFRQVECQTEYFN